MRICFPCKCSTCETINFVNYETLYKIWKTGWDQMSPEKREEAYLSAEVKCLCGNNTKFKSPMFRYMFTLIFKEMLNASVED